MPDFRQRPAASAVTLGRASYMMATTPIGTRTRRSSRPFGLTVAKSPSPMGSGRAAVARRLSAMPFIRSGVSRRRSIKDAFIPPSRAAFISSSLAASTCAAFSSSRSAIFSSASFFTAVGSTASLREASFASAAFSLTIFSISMGKSFSSMQIK